MARHRSPSGRRAHLGPPLHAAPAAAGVGGGVARSLPLPRLSYSQLSSAQLTTSKPARFVAMALAGGAMAAAGQHAFAEALPAAADGANVLRLGVGELFGGGAAAAAFTPVAAAVGSPAASLIAEPLAPVAPVAAEPAVVGAAELVKAADLQSAAADAAARATAEAAAAKTAQAAQAAKEAKEAKASAPAVSLGGSVQMLVGRVTSGFGLRGGAAHQGLDIAAPIGTPIRVPLAGTVIDSGPASGFGLWVRVRHADGTVTVYGHINRSLVRKGQQVQVGQVIAEVGNRGQSTGPHLHIEVVTPAGKKINPRPWLDQRAIGYR